MIGRNKRIDGEAIEQAADKDACAGEQDEGESKLEYDQRARKPPAAKTSYAVGAPV